MMSNRIVFTAAIFLALAVVIGAFGAHALKDSLTPQMLKTYNTGVEYHFYHALGMLMVGVLSMTWPSKWMNYSAILLGLGVLLFSGSLYLLAVTGIKYLGAITPFGGLSFITGWVFLAVGIWKR